MDGHSVPPAWCSPHATGHLGRVDESTPSFPRRTTLKSRRGSGGMGGAVGSCGPRVVGVQKRGCRVVSDDAGDSECCRKFARRLHEGCRPWCSGAVPIEASDWHRFATAGRAGGGKGAGWGERLQFGSTHPATIGGRGSGTGVFAGGRSSMRQTAVAFVMGWGRWAVVADQSGCGVGSSAISKRRLARFLWTRSAGKMRPFMAT